MDRDEIIRILNANLGKQIEVKFLDEEAQQLTIVNLDGEGFVNKVGDQLFWATFEDVDEIQS